MYQRLFSPRYISHYEESPSPIGSRTSTSGCRRRPIAYPGDGSISLDVRHVLERTC